MNTVLQAMKNALAELEAHSGSSYCELDFFETDEIITELKQAIIFLKIYIKEGKI